MIRTTLWFSFVQWPQQAQLFTDVDTTSSSHLSELRRTSSPSSFFFIDADMALNATQPELDVRPARAFVADKHVDPMAAFDVNDSVGGVDVFERMTSFSDNVTAAMMGPADSDDVIQWYRPPLLKQSAPIVVLFSIAYLIVFVLAVVNNSLVVTVIYRNPQMRTVTNYFLANLAVADIMVSFVVLPLTLLSNLFTEPNSTGSESGAEDVEVFNMEDDRNIGSQYFMDMFYYMARY
ncbi:hypothetical protein LSH36_1157g01010 [Paralvinella palmiformis]|uniref:G-protein coupled receptors family 1 profile domain-containing protein n=1 Tax=Paralvinella palmiformis TaxID=53620 RepID=A0AAD9IV43_9ANNE|nr:hypothetical protein LSH36_1157g01010 [Paralvinella palmiformis]